MKYNFYSLKKENKPLPDDINKSVEDAIDAIFHCPELLERITARRIKRGFGKLEYTDNVKKISCILQFVGGIIPKYELIAAIVINGNVLLDTRSVNNDALIYGNKQPKNG